MPVLLFNRDKQTGVFPMPTLTHAHTVGLAVISSRDLISVLCSCLLILTQISHAGKSHLPAPCFGGAEPFSHTSTLCPSCLLSEAACLWPDSRRPGRALPLFSGLSSDYACEVITLVLFPCSRAKPGYSRKGASGFLLRYNFFVGTGP